MKIAHIRISNVLGIEQLEITPGGFNSIEGPNGTGKTSVLEAIKAALSPGHDATLLRAGAEKGEVVFVLDDGNSITKRISADKSSTEVRDAEGKKLPRPAEVISGLADMLSVNPVEFLAAKKQDRVKVLLESMPLDVDVAKLTKLSGIKVSAQAGVHALHVIETVHKQVYEARTGTNRAVKEKESTVKQLRGAIPEAAGGVEGSEEELSAQVLAATTARDGEITRIDDKLSTIRDGVNIAITARREDLIAAIDKLKADAQADVDKINADLAESERKAGVVRERTHAKFNETVSPLNQALAVIRANRDTAAKREQSLLIVGQMEKELEGLRTEAQRQTDALTSIESYKSELLSALPIRGLEVRDGEVFRDGLPLDRLNTAQQVEIAVGIAKLRAGDLGVVCVDRIESLDDASLEELRRQTQEAGLQCFVTRVGGEEFSILAED